ncbi:MAG: LysR family transcriptional regulator [Desulfocapsaceae bacterium]|nr:LysR family transcriptional regulator [Desulfocapsaceae bacterium]
MIDAELYRVFNTVATCGTVSAAAEALFVTQPAVSKSIRKLEELTDCRLFIRSSKGVRLSTEGQILFEYVKKGFEHLQNGEQVLKKIRNREEGLVRVGISSTLCRYYFIPHLEAFHQRYPGIRITIVNRTSPETLKLLEGGLIDFGIISIPKKRSPFVYRELLTIRDVFVAGRDFPGLQGPVPLQALGQYPLMMLEKDNVTRQYIDAYLTENGAMLQPDIEIGSLDFLVEFARIGLGVALVIRNFIDDELRFGLLREIEVTPAPPPRQIGIVMPANLPLSVAAKAFIDALCPQVRP